MDIEISYRDMDRTESIDGHIRRRVASRLRHFSGRLTRVEVHVGDRNGPKGGPDDKRCMIEVRPANGRPIAVESRGEDLYATVTDEAEKAVRALARRFGRSAAA